MFNKITKTKYHVYFINGEHKNIPTLVVGPTGKGKSFLPKICGMENMAKSSNTGKQVSRKV